MDGLLLMVLLTNSLPVDVVDSVAVVAVGIVVDVVVVVVVVAWSCAIIL